jgi:hypothetical protein
MRRCRISYLSYHLTEFAERQSQGSSPTACFVCQWSTRNVYCHPGIRIMFLASQNCGGAAPTDSGTEECTSRSMTKHSGEWNPQNGGSFTMRFYSAGDVTMKEERRPLVRRTDKKRTISDVRDSSSPLPRRSRVHFSISMTAMG